MNSLLIGLVMRDFYVSYAVSFNMLLNRQSNRNYYGGRREYRYFADYMEIYLHTTEGVVIPL